MVWIVVRFVAVMLDSTCGVGVGSLVWVDDVHLVAMPLVCVG